MTCTEQAITFACADETLVGVLSVPRGPVAETGVVVVVGGPQYRAGSHRQFVLLARALAEAGHAVLRFDYRGMGDSTGELRNFQDVTQDIGAAIDAMQQHVPAVRQVALWGLCDGASAALLYCHDTKDARVRGLCLLNPWVRSEASLARTQVKHYYTQRLRQKEFWQKLFSGQVAAGAARGLVRSIGAALARSTPAAGASAAQPFQARMATGWSRFDGPIGLILSGDDYTAKEFLEYCAGDASWSDALAHAKVTRHDVAGADHTFSDGLHRAKVEALTIQVLPTCGRPLT